MTKTIGLTWPVFMMMAAISCGSDANHWPVQKGRVLDEATGDPIEGAHVLAFWKGAASYATTVCFHTESAITDRNGRFKIPAWTNTGKWRVAKDQYVTVTVYKSGFSKSDKTYGREQTHKQGEYYLVKDTSSGKERLQSLRAIVKSGDCSIGKEADDSYLNSFGMYKAIYNEAKQHATSNGSNGIASGRYSDLEWFAHITAGAAVHQSHDISNSERRKAINKFIQDELQ